MYKDYRSDYGLFDDLKCFSSQSDAGYIGEMAVVCMNEVPTNFNVTPLTPTSVRASWEFNSSDSMPLEVVIRGCKLLYRLRNSSAQLSTAIVWGNSTFSKNISVLEKYTEYEFEVLTLTANGNGPSSSVLVVRTDEDVPSQAPVNLNVVSKTSTSIMVSWQPPPLESRNGIIIGFKLFHKRKGSAESENTVVVQGGTTLRKSITGLLKYTEYEVQVLAFTAVGDGPKTLIKTVRTAREFSVPTIEEDVSPAFVICEMGTLCLLFCYATSKYPKKVIYSWTKNGIRLTDGDTFKIMNTSVVVRPHRMEDYGVYACKVSNGIHTKTYNIILGVKLNSSAVVIRRAENESHDIRFVVTVTALSTVIMLLLIPIGLLLWQRRKMSRQNTSVSENWHTHSR
ncbi:protein sidekick-1-like isoform X1 [Acropora palmata]|uniref:protein sidekick-1-like isoform X1 n=2 Tax=Acropora palmata TaxID=6131 RepID=UPI003DA14EAC